jgi:UDP-N-acetylmuramate--alanine ligase
LASLRLQVPGEHNVRNALAALTVADLLGLPIQLAARALGEFCGTGRRFEVRGEAAGVTVIDDYAHLPTEIKATLSAARARWPERRLWAVWQPHTYSRTRTLLDDFASAFDQAGQVIVLDVYAARESAPSDGFSSRQVVDAMLARQGRRTEDGGRRTEPVFRLPSPVFIPTLKAAAQYLLEQLQSGDVVLVLSAGDADQLSVMTLQELQKQRARATAWTDQNLRSEKNA